MPQRPLTLSERLARADWLLLGLGVALGLLGVVIVQAGTHADAAVDYGAAQMRWLVLGVAACLLMLAVPYRMVVALRYLWYAGGLLLLLLVLVLGRGKSAQRWISLGGFHMQPSELMKVILVVTLAGYIRYDRSHRRFAGLAGPFALTLVPVLLIVKQPDLGTALLFIPVLFVLLYAAGARPRHLLLVGLAGLLAGAALYATPGALNEYQKNRVRAFLLQDREDTDLRRGLGHQNYISRLVAGTATFTGVGVGEEAREAVEPLSESHSDFVFPVVLTAFGLLGALGLLGLYALLVWRILRTSVRVREPSGRLLALGVGALFACQTLINAAMTLGLLPIVGMPLPFLSAGGSSLLACFVALGLVLNVGADHPVEFGRGDFD